MIVRRAAALVVTVLAAWLPLGCASIGARRADARALAVAPRVPRTMEPERLLAIVDAVPPDPNGVPARVLDALAHPYEAFALRVDRELAWLAQAPLTPATGAYLRLALDCSYAYRRRGPGAPSGRRLTASDTAPGAPPLVSYRAATCTRADTTVLRRVLAAVPAFDEAAYFLARATVQDAERTGGDEVGALLDRARARFPGAPGVAFLAGWLQTTIGDCEAAVPRYDAAIESATLRTTLRTALRRGR